jgi:hypothetical protein
MPQFFQSHEQNGYRAKITIEWSWPEDIDPVEPRENNAEFLAAEALDATFKKPLEIVAAMLGKLSRRASDSSEGS